MMRTPFSSLLLAFLWLSTGTNRYVQFSIVAVNGIKILTEMRGDSLTNRLIRRNFKNVCVVDNALNLIFLFNWKICSLN